MRRISAVVVFIVLAFLTEVFAFAEQGFDHLAYLSANPDLPSDWEKSECMTHYKRYGFGENRAVTFNPDEYLNANPDLPANWILSVALNHYNMYGRFENRLLAFDGREYLSLYPDLPQEWNDDQAYAHYVNHGIREGRVASFDETAYLELYSDLQSSWGQTEAFQHYIYYGQYEGRAYDPYDEGAFGSVYVEIETVQSTKKRVTDPDIPLTDLEKLVSGNSTFAFDFYTAIREAADNIIYSPYSISLALAMTYAGASESTETQMADVFHFSLPQTDLHPAFNWLDLELESRGEGAEGTDEAGFQLNIANAIWGQTGYFFLETFLDVLAENYGAGLNLLDFQTATEDARNTINSWVSEKTRNRIENLIPQGAITSDTRLVLTNAIYFNAAWALPFDTDATQPGIFTLLDGSEVDTEMMGQTEYFKYAQGDGYQVVELPYDGRELAMTILLPDEGMFTAFESELNANRFDTYVSEMVWTNIAILMPGFTFETQLSLSEILADMGMPDAFNPLLADFSGMNGAFNLLITDVLHKAFIAVDESGTEAAAATAVIVGETGIPEPPLAVDIDRPFIFVIRDLATGSILFVGRVMNPETGQ